MTRDGFEPDTTAIRASCATGHRLHDDAQAPHEIVTELVAAAQAAATGQIPEPEELLADYAALEQVEHFTTRGLVNDPGPLLPQRVCLFDPARPAPDLLEDLLIGIGGCLWLYSEHVEDNQRPVFDRDEGDPDPDDVAAERHPGAGAVRHRHRRRSHRR